MQVRCFREEWIILKHRSIWSKLDKEKMITKKIFRISSIIPCLLCIAISFAQKIDKFSCDFEDNICQWTQDSSDDFDWTRNQVSKTPGTGPLADHTNGPLTTKKQGPGSIRHSGGKCIHHLLGALFRPKEGDFLVTYVGCGIDRHEFQLWPNGTLMLTKYGMCVKPTGPVTDGVKVGLFSSCDATDTWSWTAQGSLQYKKKMCLKPETGGGNPRNHVELVLDSVCDERQNFFEFVTTSGWYLFVQALNHRQKNKARLISPSTTRAKSCLLFFYHMFGLHIGKLQVYVKSGGKMDIVWSLSGEQGDKWHQAQVAVNNQKAPYQFVIEGVRGLGAWGDIAIDDISLMDSCPARENEASKPTSIDNNGSKDKGTTDDSSRIIIIATTVGVGVFLSIVYIVLLVKYKRLKRASTPVNIPLETNEISPEPLLVDEEEVYETVPNVDRKFYEDVATNESEDISVEGRASFHDWDGVPSNADKTSDNKTTVKNGHLEPSKETFGRVNRRFYDDVATNANASEDSSAEGRASLHDWVGVPSNADKTSGYEIPVENEHQERGNETVARLDREFYIDVDTNAKKSEEISAEDSHWPTQGRTSDHEEVEVPSNSHQASGHTELNKRLDTLKTGATGDGDSRAFLKEVDIIDIYIIPVPEEAQHETSGQNETCVEPKLSPENPVYTELDVKDRNTTENGSYQKLVKKDSDYVTPAHERRESYEDIKMGGNLPAGYEELDQRKVESEME